MNCLHHFGSSHSHVVNRNASLKKLGTLLFQGYSLQELNHQQNVLNGNVSSILFLRRGLVRTFHIHVPVQCTWVESIARP